MNSRKRLNTTLIAALAFFACMPIRGAEEARPSLERKIDQAFDSAISERRIVGGVVIVVQDGKVVYRKAKGLADRENNRPMKEDAVFRLASMSKPLVSAAALRLIDQGKLKLDDPVDKWIPDFLPRLKDGKRPNITIFNLLTHTSGLDYTFSEDKNGPYHRLRVSDGLNDVGISLEENVRRISAAPLLFAPGTEWRYSLSIDVLGRVIEKVTQADLAESVAQLVTKPLNMRDTGFYATDAARLAVPYVDGKPAPVKMADPYSLPVGNSTIEFSPSRALKKDAYPSGGAGMVGAADDYALFLETLRKGGAPLLKPETCGKIFSNTLGDMKISARGPGWGWGLLAAYLKDQKTAHALSHVGTIEWGGVYGHAWWVDSEAKLTVVILTNTALEGMSGKFPNDVKQAVYEDANGVPRSR